MTITIASPLVLLALMAPVVFLVRKVVVLAAVLTLLTLAAAAAMIAIAPDAATAQLLSLELRLSPLGRLAAVALLATTGVIVADVWLDEPAYNFFPTALGVGAVVVAVLLLTTPLATYAVLLIGLLLPVGSFTFQIHRNRSVEAAIRHFAFVSLGGTIGLAALALAASLPRDQPQSTFVLLVVVLYVAFALKLAVIPFHTHAALLAAEAPATALALYFGVLTPVTVIAFVQILTQAGLLPSLLQLAKVQDLLLGIGGLSAVGGALLATGATDLRRLVVCSVISDLGIALVGIGTFSGPGIVGGIAIALATGASATQQLLAAGTLERRADGGPPRAARAPLAAAAFVAGGIGLIGAPPVVAFPGRFYVELMAYSFATWLGAALVLATLLLLIAQLRVALGLFAEGLPSWRPERRPVAGIAGAVIFAGLLAGGIAPDAFLRPIAAFAEEFLRALRPL
ncbi:MAG TPA: proton-conducting transporter membrane subunit [Candidatus Limnocylindria bacterium]